MAADDDGAPPVDALSGPVRVAAALAALCVAASACSSHKTAATPAPSGAQAASHATRHERGIPIPLPLRAKSSKDVDPVHDVGEEIFITKDGFKPQSLVAKVEAKLLFINETGETQQVRFTNWDWKSPPIKPDASVSYVPHETIAVSYALVANEKLTGSVVFEPWYDPSDPNAPKPTAPRSTP